MLGSASSGQNQIYHVIPAVKRVPKMHIIFMLVMLRVITIPSTLCDQILKTFKHSQSVLRNLNMFKNTQSVLRLLKYSKIVSRCSGKSQNVQK